MGHLRPRVKASRKMKLQRCRKCNKLLRAHQKRCKTCHLLLAK